VGGLPTASPHGHSFGLMVDCPRSRKPATELIVELAAGTIPVVLVAVLGFGARPVDATSCTASRASMALAWFSGLDQRCRMVSAVPYFADAVIVGYGTRIPRPVFRRGLNSSANRSHFGPEVGCGARLDQFLPPRSPHVLPTARPLRADATRPPSYEVGRSCQCRLQRSIRQPSSWGCDRVEHLSTRTHHAQAPAPPGLDQPPAAPCPRAAGGDATTTAEAPLRFHAYR
jgi:hypothetical protein